MLARKFSLLVLLPLLIVLVGGQATVYLVTAARMREEGDRRLLDTADALNKSIRIELDGVRADLKAMRSHRQLDEYFKLLDFGGPEEADLRLVELEDSYFHVGALKPRCKSFRLYGPDGLALISIVDQVRSYRRTEVGNRRWFRLAMRATDEKALVTGVFPERSSGMPALTIYRPVLIGNRVRGVLAVDVLVERLAEFLLPAANAAHGGWSALVDERGGVVASSGAGAPVGDIAAERATQRVMAGFAGVSAIGGDMRAAYRPQEHTELGIVVTSPLERALGSTRRMRTVVIVVTLGAFLAVALAGFALVRRTVRPVRALIDGAGRVAKGELDLELQVDTADEIGELADSFNRMTRSLRSARAIAEERNLELLEAVGAEEKRSAELGVAYNNLQETQRQLAQAEKLSLLGQLAGGIAHDFNNLLGGILGCADLLQRGLGNEAERERYVEMILETGQRAADLVQQLLAFARPAPTSRAALDLHEVIEEVLRILEHTIDPRIELRKRLAAGNATVEGDRSALQSALLNLGVNARDALPDGGQLTFATRSVELDQDTCRRFGHSIAPGPFLEITVADDGSGMSQEVKARVFEPFFSTKPVGQGTGLGLAAVYGTVHGHGGEISLYSEEGQGTVFRIFLPVVASSGQAVARRMPHVVEGTGTILVVDDEPVIRNIARDMLRSLGYDVVLAEGGRQALDIFRARGATIDLVILDLVMPGMNGGEVLRALKRIDSEARVLIASGFHLDMDMPDIRGEGASGFLSKPFILAGLSQAVAAALASQPQAVGALRVLVAEDSAVNREVASAFLRELGHGAVLVEDGQEAVRRALSEPFDLVLMDLEMPELDGIAATGTIRLQESRGGRGLPIIAMTGHDTAEERERCRAAGMNGYLTKPMSLASLRAEIARVLQAPSQARKSARGEELRRRIAAAFREEAPALLQNLRRAERDGDAEALHRAAHTLYGSLTHFEREEAAKLADQLQQQGQSGDLADARRVVDDLILHCDKLLADLEAGQDVQSARRSE